MKGKDLTGQRFGRLTAVKDIGKKSESRLWLCDCDCGNQKQATVSDLRSGKVKSCGCLQRDKSSESAKSNIETLLKHRSQNFEGGTNAGYIKKGTVNKNNRSGHRGVSWSARRGKWVAKIQYKGKNCYLGSYDNVEDAVKARTAAEEKLFPGK